jgi:uncharacterized protein
MSSQYPFWARTFRHALASLAGQHFGGSRDLYQVLGYPRTVGAPEFFSVYSRQDIAGRIVDAGPDATWREQPTVKPKDAEADTPWQIDFEKFAEKFDLWGTLCRLDRLTGVGHYGVLMLGLDGAEPSETVAARKDYGLLYLTPHSELSAQITNWVADARNQRYSQPEVYRVTTGVEWTGAGGGQKSLAVHWTRTLHVAERAMSDRSIGVPRLERVFNRLMDLDKLLGGSAEVYWQNAAQLRAWKADADTEWGQPEKDAMTAELEELAHGLRRDVRVRGVEPQSLSAPTQGTDASGNIDKQLDMIAGATGIPKRILMGSERGELSSEQDENNWAARVAERRQVYAGPIILRPLVQRFIDLGILAAPEGGEFEIVWPESDALGEQARADIASKKAQAVATYAGTPGSEFVVPPQEFRRWLGEDEESEFAVEELERPGASTPDGRPLDESDAAVVVQFGRHRHLVTNANPRPLYVRRLLKNWRTLEKWALAQGFTSTVGEAMHVTVAYSRTPVDWIKAGEAYSRDGSGELAVPPGGPRVVEALGPNGAVVLHFASSDLCWRHEDIKRIGASWDYSQYQPHVTITYDAPAGLDIAKVPPYRGPLEFGPEIFEDVDDDAAAAARSLEASG